MVGRNFCRESAPLFEPKIDARRNTDGTTGMEFPVLNYIAGRAACVGFDHIVAAPLLSLLFMATALAALFAVAHSLSSRRAATLAIGLYAAAPLTVYYCVSIQPDVPAVALALTAIAFLLKAPLQPSYLWLSALCWAAAILIKLPVIVFGLVPLHVFMKQGARKSLRDWRMWMFGAIALVPPMAWYLHARRLQRASGLDHFYLGKGLPELARDWVDPSFYAGVFGQLFDVTAFPVVSLVAVAVALTRYTTLPDVLKAMVISVLCFWFLAGGHAAHHYYYGLLVTPVLALVAAFGLDQLVENTTGRWRRPFRILVGVVLVPLAMTHALIRTAHWVPADKKLGRIAELRKHLDRLDSTRSAVALYSNNNPTLLWFMDRKGWLLPHDEPPPTELEWSLIDRRALGAERDEEVQHLLEAVPLTREYCNRLGCLFRKTSISQ